MTLVDKQRVSRRFASAIPYYDLEARPQLQMAQQLVDMLIEMPPSGTVFETGCGTGLLSRLLVEHLGTERYTYIFNDLCPEMDVPLREKLSGYPLSSDFLAGDAENLSWPTPCVLLASGCSLQWWHAPHAFFQKAAASLISGGQLLLSTFAPDNLHQLTSVTGAGLSYLTAEDIVATLRRTGFESIHHQQHTFTLTFPSLFALLTHLKQTGVNSTATTSVPRTRAALQELEVTYRTRYGMPDDSLPLTYSALLFTAQKK